MSRRVINIPVPYSGLDTKNDTDTIGDTFTPYCMNVDFDQPGFVSQRPGTEKVADEVSLANPGKGLVVFRKANGTEYLVSKFGGSYYSLATPSSPTNTLIASGMSSGVATFGQINDYLYIATTIDAVQRWSGSGAFVSGTIPKTFFLICVFGNRMWGVEAANPNKVWFSDIGDPTTYGVNSFIEFGNDGGSVTALQDNNGVFEIHRGKKGTWAVSPSTGLVPFLAQKTIVLEGAYSQQAAVKVENSCVYLSSDGIRSSGQLPYYPTGLYGTVMSDLINPTFLSIQSNKETLGAAAYFKRKLYMSVPMFVNTNNDAILTNYSGVWSMYTNVYAAQMVEWQGMLYYTDSRKGQLWRFNPDVKSDDGVAIPFVYQTKYFNLKRPHLIKYLEHMIFRWKSDQGTTIRLSLSTDFNNFSTVYTIDVPSINNDGTPPPEVGDMEMYPGGDQTSPGGVVFGQQGALTFFERKWDYGGEFYFIGFRVEHQSLNKTLKMKDFDVIFEEGSSDDQFDIN